jgi:hypothetical protein
VWLDLYKNSTPYPMKKLTFCLQRTSIFLIALLLLATSGSSNAADTRPFKYVRLSTADIADRAALISVMENWTAFIKKEVPSYHPWHFHIDDERKASWANFASSLSDFDEQDKAFGAAAAKYREKSMRDPGEWMRSFHSENSTIWEVQPELSSNPMGRASAEQPFVMVGIFHLKRDKVTDFAEGLKDLNALDHEAGIKPSRMVLTLKYGPDRPAIAIVSPAKDVIDYHTRYAQQTAMRQKHARFADIIRGLEQCVRSRENHRLTLQPELSKLAGN